LQKPISGYAAFFQEFGLIVAKLNLYWAALRTSILNGLKVKEYALLVAIKMLISNVLVSISNHLPVISLYF